MSDKLQFLQELEMSRLAIRRDFSDLGDELNVARKIEKVIRKRPAAWLVGAAITGFVAAGWRRRPAPRPAIAKGSKGKRGAEQDLEGIAAGAARLTFWGFLLATVKMLLPFLRPLFSAYASRRMAEMAMSLGRK
jgi:hypothetical protein